MGLLFPAVLLAAGCAVGPDYERPRTATPAAWGETADTSTADLSKWWTVFGDEILNSLVGRALRANPDLKIAVSRVTEARAQLGVVLGGLLPEIDLSATYADSRVSPNGEPFPLTQISQQRYHMGFDASWEIDFFGGARRGYEAASADYESWVENRRAVLVTLLGDVARNYVTLRGQQLLHSVQRRNVSTARGTADIARARLAAGVATAFDVARADAQLASAEAALLPIEISLKQSIHRLSVLLGLQPGTLIVELSAEKPIPSAPPRIVLGLPSDLLLRRPDVRQAERKLASATASIGVAVSDLYPKFSLTGSIGLDSLGAGNLIKWDSRSWSFGPTISWPIFAAGRLKAQVAVQDAQQEQAASAYEKSVLTALEDVENALIAYLREGDRRRSLEAAVTANLKAVELADDLYRQGLTSFTDVLDAQRALYSAQLDLGRSTADVTLDLVALYKALGGGWELSP
jgi:multidrug efflux system outer membrane protein